MQFLRDMFSGIFNFVVGCFHSFTVDAAAMHDDKKRNKSYFKPNNWNQIDNSFLVQESYEPYCFTSESVF